jgi:hypothetical protein
MGRLCLEFAATLHGPGGSSLGMLTPIEYEKMTHPSEVA